MNEELALLRSQIKELQQENKRLKAQFDLSSSGKTVIVPDEFKIIFEQAENKVAEYFTEIYNSAESGEIVIHGQRYVLIRSASLSYEFLDILKELYSNYPDEKAVRIGNNFLYDIGQVLGRKDANSFHTEMGLFEPLQKLSAGPVHFAYTGWANVEILPESNPTPDDDFLLKYHHHNSFEAQSWIKAGRKSNKPVCVMNAGYSAGWCEESFEIPLTAVEISCAAKGDECCTFIMAPTHRINDYLKDVTFDTHGQYDVPVFFKRKAVEDKLRASLQEKETLLSEVHTRVKNNLQLISSLFKLQMFDIKDREFQKVFQRSLDRVNTLAQIHDLMYSEENLTVINLEHFVARLISTFKQQYPFKSYDVQVELNFNLKNTGLNHDKAIPLGLILNEIASETFGVPFENEGKIEFSLSDCDKAFRIICKDNRTEALTKDPMRNQKNSLLSIFCEQIDAELTIKGSSEGLTYTIQFDK
jgi:two-component sensor histidine kinase/predicted hydrocarbon binding protein